MAISFLQLGGYRSVRNLDLTLGRVNVLTGPNGCGKSNVYRSLILLSQAAAGNFAATLAGEGGMPSVLWAGQRKKGPLRLTIGVTMAEMSYDLSCGVSERADSHFALDPKIREEDLWYLDGSSKHQLLERRESGVWARDADGNRVTYPLNLADSESVLAQLREPHRFPLLSALRHDLLSWRFYHDFRTDAEAPLRQAQFGTRTPILSHDGNDLAAAIETIREIGDWSSFQEHVERAFPGSSVEIEVERGRFGLVMRSAGIHRTLEARELSDGTLRYLCLMAALMSPRPPSVMGLNEPERSIHPELLEPLARLIVHASQNSQLWISTHSVALAEHLERHSGTPAIRLHKVDGETKLNLKRKYG